MMKFLQRWGSLCLPLVCLITVTVALSLLTPTQALAAKNPAKQPLTEVNVSLGNSDGELKFFSLRLAV